MCAVLIFNKLNTVKEHVFTFMLSAGLYPEIPEASQLDFSSLKEEVAPDSLLLFYLSLFRIETLYTGVLPLTLPPRSQGEWLLLFNYLIPYSELLDQSGQAFDGEGGGARVNIKTEQVGRVRLMYHGYRSNF